MGLKNKIVLSIATLFFMVGCSSKNVEEYNKPATYWYSQIVKSISNNDLELADNYYSSMQSEHTASPMLKEATMSLALAHIENEEYILGEYFLDEFIKRYADEEEKVGAEFLKVKAKYMALPRTGRDQAFLDETLQAALDFKDKFYYSSYIVMLDTMITRMKMAKFILNEDISDLYGRLDKPDSAKYYKDTNSETWLEDERLERASAAWYRSWFEGDGGASWYDFMVPHTKSVVSRNSNKSDEKDEDDN